MGIIITNPEVLDGIIGEIANDILLTAQDTLKSEGHIVTGNIIKPQNSKAKPESKFEWQVIFSAPYAKHLEYGTKAHDIYPKNKKALAFEIDGKKVITKRVRHPGTAPIRFLDRALHEVKSKWR